MKLLSAFSKVFILLFTIIIASYISYAQKSAQLSIDSLLKVLPAQADDTNKVTILNDLAYAYSGINPDEGVKYGKSGLRLSEKLGYKKGISESFNALGLNFNNKSDYLNALKYHFKALELREELNNSFDIAVSSSNIGIVYDAQGNHEKSLEYYSRALKIFREINYSQGIATNLGNIGLLYTTRNDYDSALKFLLEALGIMEELKDTSAMAACIGNIGNVYLKKKDYEKALDYDLKSLELNEKIGDPAGTGIGHCNVGEIYLLIAMNEDKNLLKKLFAGNKNAALDKSISHLTRSIVIFKQLGFLNGLQEVNKYLSTAYEQKGDFENALRTSREHITIRESVFNEESMNKIASLETRRLNDIRQKEIEIHKLRIQKAEKDRWFLIGAIVFLFLITGVLYNRYRLKQKSNNQLKSAFDNLQSTQQQLIEQEKLASLGALAAGIAHEIQNPLNFVNNFSDVSNELVAELTEITNENERSELLADLKNNLSKISHHGKRASNIIKNMLLHSRKESGQKTATDINILMEEALSLSFHSIQAKHPGFKCDVVKSFAPGLPLVRIVSSDISRVVLNILNNAFYSLNEKSNQSLNDELYKSKLELETRQEDDFIIIVIKDNGNGIPDNIMQNIFEPFFTSKPSNEGTGLGLSISYDIIKDHGGDIVVSNNNGATFTIELPI